MSQQTRPNPERWRRQISACAAARQATIARLRALYPDDWERIYSEEAAKRGVTARPPKL